MAFGLKCMSFYWLESKTVWLNRIHPGLSAVCLPVAMASLMFVACCQGDEALRGRGQLSSLWKR